MTNKTQQNSPPHHLPKINVYLGGSFDPVHLAHVAIAEHVLNCLKKQNANAKIYFLPTAGSPFKQNQTAQHHRVAMLKRALEGTPFLIDARELDRPPPVYSIDTFKKIRTEVGQSTSVIFVMGLDAINSLERWKNGNKLLNYCHFWVLNRQNTGSDSIKPMQDNIPELLDKHLTTSPEKLISTPCGSVYLDKYLPPQISSTQIRCNTNDAKTLVSLPVWAYIKCNQLYKDT